MAIPRQQQSYDALAIIDAIDHASLKELALLKDIHRSVIARNRANPSPGEDLHKSNKAILNAILSRRNAGNDNQLTDNGNYLPVKRVGTGGSDRHLPQLNRRLPGAKHKKNDNSNRKSAIKQRRSFKVSSSGGLSAVDAADITAKAIKSAEKRLYETGNSANENVLTQTNNVENHITIAPKDDTVSQKISNARKWQPDAIVKQDLSSPHQRDANGRFTSQEKSQKNEDRQEKAETRSLFKKLSSVLGGKKGQGDELVNVAGSATGGVLWSAGKEIYDLTQGVREKVVNFDEWNSRKKAGKGTVSADPIRFPDVTTNGGTQSQRAYQSNKGNNVVSMVRDQNKALVENDRTIIEELKEIAENTRGEKKAGGGFTGKLLGAIGAKALGKLIGTRVLSGLAAALGGGAILNLLKRLIGGGGESINVPDIGRPGKSGKPGKTPTPKKVKGKGKLAKIAMAAGATVATGAAAVKGVLTGGDKLTSAAEPMQAATADAEKQAAKKAEAKAGDKIAHKAEKEVLKKGAEKALAKTALKAVPIVGTVIGAGMDAVDGYADTAGQKEAFSIGDSQDVTGRQKAEYTAANVLNMGGLVSGGAGLLAKGASALGFDGVAEKLTFDTGDIAKSLDGGVSTVKDAFSSGNDKQIDAIRDGTKQTTEAISKLDKSLTDGGAVPVAQPGAAPKEGQSGMAQAISEPTANIMSDDLNIGGSNAANRSFRNNNFGNIKYVGQSDATLESANAKGEQTFAKYDSPEEGMRGLANQLSRYADGTSKAVNYKKLTNVRDIITQFAPNNENDTEAYIGQLSKKLGVQDNETLDLNNPAVMSNMIRQIATIEGGNPQVSNRFIETAIGSRQGGKWQGKFNAETLEKLNKQRTSQGLAALASTDQRANPERYTLTDKLMDGAKDLGGAAWDTSMSKLGEFRDYSDAQLGKVFGNVEGLRIRAPDKNLTLPAGDKVPVGMARAALNPDDIGKSLTTHGATSATASSKAEEDKAVDGSLVGIARPVDDVVPLSELNKPRLVSSNGSVSKGKTAPANIQEAEGEANKGWLGSTVDVLKDIGGKSLDVLGDAGKNTLTSMGVDVDNPVQWAAGQTGSSVGGLVSGLTGGLMQDTPFSFLSDTVSSALGNKAGALTSGAISSFSTTPPAPVTDLAASGVVPVTGRDKDSRGSDDQQTSLLERIAKAVEKKDSEKKEISANPNRTTETAQPSPRKDIPLSIMDSSLDKLFS
ncbi:hypothetical protein AB6T85_21725 [Erwinia sp. ACCC 02193]|uniref:Lytic transglycosylase domain-containing protein n=1 Tax=Erwinia aeris TaxID=3239803 RepID=A0ABV4EDK8_9GAMM